jgi:molybdopterin molybdotransferase
MISVSDAIQLIRSRSCLLAPVWLPLTEAAGLVLAEDVYAGISIPNFNQSSMDGYAFRFEDFATSRELLITGEMAAGDNKKLPVQPGQAVRIFTGAAVPEGFDTVVMQEKTTVEELRLFINDDSLAKGSNIRLKGSEINAGELALSKGTILSPAAVGFLAGLGTTIVAVHPKPSVYLIVTGKELQHPGVPLQYGQVYESNGMMLQSALRQLQVQNIRCVHVGDNVAEITTAINTALQSADLVLLSGGVSVGDYDFVVQSAESCGVSQLFHRVAQRPGKPLYAGMKGEKFVFGLPGNPSSVLSCFYNYVVPAIEELTGRKNLLERKRLLLLAPFSKKIQLRQFLKASCTLEGVMPLAAQESFRLSSFSVANCLIDLPEEPRDYAAGEVVEVLLLPYL